MIDFERTFRIRRAICLILQQGQKSESHVAERSGQIAINGKRELLLLFSAWLLELNSTNAISEAELAEVQSITHTSLDKWVQLQQEAMQLKNKLTEAEGKEKEAIAAFQKKAPFGTATRLFADAESKSHIKILQSNMVVTQKYRESLSKALTQNVKKRQDFGEAFFRDCLSQCDKLVSTQVLGKEICAILNHLTTQTNEIWAGHLKQQTEDLEKIAKLMETLRANCRDTLTPPLVQHTVQSLQEQSETQSRQGNI